MSDKRISFKQFKSAIMFPWYNIEHEQYEKLEDCRCDRIPELEQEAERLRGLLEKLNKTVMPMEIGYALKRELQQALEQKGGGA